MAQKLLDPKQLKTAMRAAVTRTTRRLANQVVARAQEVLHVKKSGLVAKTLSDKRRPVGYGITKAGGDVPQGVVIVRKIPIRLIAFKVSVRKKTGVTAIVRKDRPPIVLRHAFRARVGSHTGIFLRAKGRGKGGKLTKRGYARRLPIEEQFGVSLYAVVNVPHMLSKILKDGQEFLIHEFAGQMSRFTGGKLASFVPSRVIASAPLGEAA